MVEQDRTKVQLKCSNTGSTATTRLILTHQIMLALHHTSTVLQHKSLVDHPLEVLKVPGLQSTGQPIIHAIQKAILLLLISVHFIWSLARQLGELGDILIHRHGPLFQILKLLILQFDHS
jgi:hypothetical protein